MTRQPCPGPLGQLFSPTAVFWQQESPGSAWMESHAGWGGMGSGEGGGAPTWMLGRRGAFLGAAGPSPGADQGPGVETGKVSSLSPAPLELLQEPRVPLLMPSFCLALAQHCLKSPSPSPLKSKIHLKAHWGLTVNCSVHGRVLILVTFDPKFCKVYSRGC